MSIRKAVAAAAVLLGLTVNVPVMAQDATSRPTATPLKLNQFMKPQAKPANRPGKVATGSARAKVVATATGKRVASTATKKSKFAGTNVQCRNSCKVFRPFAAPAYGRDAFRPPTGPLPRKRAGGLCERPYHRGEGHENAI